MILLKIGIIKLVEFTLWVLLLLIDWKSTIVSTIKDAVAKKGEMLMKFKINNIEFAKTK
jgi:hypothetical protein